MVSPVLVLSALCLFMAVLFALALWAARRSAAGRSVVNNPVVYSLGLTVLYTSWTFYGSVGKAASIGMLFFGIYLGTMLPLFFWWTVARKMVRIKNSLRITSIADFISARYDKSAGLAALVTGFSLVGIMPYMALQLKAIISTFNMMSAPAQGGLSWLINEYLGTIITGLMIVFTIVFGVRRLEATERHPGMVMAVAAEGVFKLGAFVLVGLFITYYLYGGLADIFDKFSRLPPQAQLDIPRSHPRVLFMWMSHMVIAMFAVIFLPRQFHMTVIENSDENHIRTAMWLLPTYMLLITIFTFPIAVGGILAGLPAGTADTFVLRLPLDYGNTWLALAVFLGGVAASSSMIMISAMTMSTMLTNHILLPCIEWVTPLGFLRRYLLQCRCAGVALAIGIGYAFERIVGASYMLVSMGVISFAAAAQFAPSILGGLFWKKGNRVGALAGLTAGIALWGYTMILPAFARSGWISDEIVKNGPWSLGLLKPEQLFGVTSIEPITNTVFWSLAFNLLGYVIGSALAPMSREERSLAADYVDALNPKARFAPPERQPPTVDLAEKLRQIEAVLLQYFSPYRARRTLNRCLRSVQLYDKAARISMIEFAGLYNEMERTLAGAIGAASARSAFKKSNIFSVEESDRLSAEYANILAELRITPEELKRKIDYYQEREVLLSRHAADLEERIAEREEEIKQRKQAEERLRQAEEKYRSIFENAVEGIYQTTREGRFLNVNMALARMLAYDSPEELIDRVTDIRTQLYVKPERRDEFLDRLAGEGSISGFEAQFYRKDGKVMWASLNARPVSGENGEILYVEGTFQDITAAKQAQEEKARLEDQLRQAQKMEAIGRLAGGVAHDFNNLLTAMIGYSNLLMQQLPEGTEKGNRVAQIKRAAERAAALTHQLLAFSRKQMLEVRVLDLNDVILELREMLRRIIGEDVELITLLDPSLAPVEADPGQIQQIVMNLAVNGRDAMPRGGTLVIQTANTLLDEEYARRAREVAPGRYVMLSVSDNGSGMPPTIMSRIFEPFFTTKAKGVGTGLGLSTVYGIVKQHRGNVTVYSEPDRGSCFKIYLPVAASETEAELGASSLTAQPTGEETVLVVEDEQIVRELACEVLEMLGYTTLQAGDGDEALRIGQEYPGSIHLLLTDVVLPQIDGKTLFRRFVRIRPHTRVLFMSGYTEDAIVRHGVLDPDVHFLAKPFTVEALAGKVREILDETS